ncbi:PREDICTED: translation initiation factor IF-2-like, partial [Chinchilla lanigera]|uniref:translation initiation factor IF-2-like n=1 Tax=Chinchilla lanigera TaxID=34839 RepID=UPI0006961686
SAARGRGGFSVRCFHPLAKERLRPGNLQEALGARPPRRTSRFPAFGAREPPQKRTLRRRRDSRGRAHGAPPARGGRRALAPPSVHGLRAGRGRGPGAGRRAGGRESGCQTVCPTVDPGEGRRSAGAAGTRSRQAGAGAGPDGQSWGAEAVETGPAPGATRGPLSPAAPASDDERVRRSASPASASASSHGRPSAARAVVAADRAPCARGGRRARPRPGSRRGGSPGRSRLRDGSWAEWAASPGRAAQQRRARRAPRRVEPPRGCGPGPGGARSGCGCGERRCRAGAGHEHLRVTGDGWIAECRMDWRRQEVCVEAGRPGGHGQKSGFVEVGKRGSGLEPSDCKSSLPVIVPRTPHLTAQ